MSEVRTFMRHTVTSKQFESGGVRSGLWRFACLKPTPLDHSELKEVGQNSVANQFAKLRSVSQTDAPSRSTRSMKPESVSKSLRIGFGPYTDASSGWSKLTSVDATEASCATEVPSL